MGKQQKNKGFKLTKRITGLFLTALLLVSLYSTAVFATSYSTGDREINLSFPNTYRKQIQACSYNGKTVYFNAEGFYSSYRLYNFSYNKVYLVRYRTMAQSGEYGKWVKKYVVFSSSLNKSLVNNKRIVKVKTPKIKNVKYYNVYTSTSSNSGFKKAKAKVKPGKSVTIKKVHGSSLIRYKNYYVKLVPVLKNGKKATPIIDGFYIYTK
ncbi:MAG: hypothetical protein K6F55_08860 [Eubacterium sp.]|nr:hypothetical protein [Eubacterium sp.]